MNYHHATLKPRVIVLSSGKNVAIIELVNKRLHRYGFYVFTWLDNLQVMKKDGSGGYVTNYDQLDEVMRRQHNVFGMIDKCDVVALLLPSGRSSHWEAGYAMAKGKDVVVCGAKERDETIYELLQSKVHMLSFWALHVTTVIKEVLNEQDEQVQGEPFRKVDSADGGYMVGDRIS
jgi:nucleoside 2-deoxyribosyltransferase